MLPNPKALGCKSTDCSQAWLEKSTKTNAEYPKQVVIDLNQGCVYGITAVFDKSVPFAEIKAAIDERYGKWAASEFAKSPLGIWRVESEKFAIQLSVATEKDEKRNIADAGTKQAIYLAFGGRSACDIH